MVPFIRHTAGIITVLFVLFPVALSQHVVTSSSKAFDKKEKMGKFVHFEAEDDALLLGSEISSTYGGFKGTGYVELGSSSGDSAQWKKSLEVSKTGKYKLRFRYSATSDDDEIECELLINSDDDDPILLEDTSTLDTWSIKTVSDVLLTEGEELNIKVVTNNEGNGPNLDWFEIELDESSETFSLEAKSSKEGDGSIVKKLPDRQLMGRVTYRPGDLTSRVHGLILSAGLSCRVIAQTGRKVPYRNGRVSRRSFHTRPDGADVFEHSSGKYSYVSNSEVRVAGKGGVGALLFNENNEVVNYQMLLTNTKTNCSGGRTPWNTWLSCEEHSKGQIWEVHPFGKPIFDGKPYQKTVLSMGTKDGNRYEAVAHDNRDKKRPVFYYTVDRFNGEVTRFIPDERVARRYETKKMLATEGQVRFLKLIPSSNRRTGRYQWTRNLDEARQSAKKHYPNCEGIEFDEDKAILYFTCKRISALFEIDIDKNTYRRVSTRRQLQGTPDQLRLMCREGDSGLLYFAEEGGMKGVHARYPNGDFVSILYGPDFRRDETSGIAFSPDKMHMYYAVQDKGLIFDVYREDGHPFNARHLPIRLASDVALPLSEVYDSSAMRSLITPDSRDKKIAAHE